MNPLSAVVADALDEVLQQPPGPAQVARAEQALVLAQGTGVFVDELFARMTLGRARYHVSQPPEQFTNYVWLRRALDGPEELSEEVRSEIFWMLKWALTSMLHLPGIPLPAVRSMLDDVEAAFVAEGWQLRPVLGTRRELAELTGDAAELARVESLFEATPRDDLSDCHACETRQQAHWKASTDPAAALQVLGPVLNRHLTCTHEPHIAYSHAALWLLRLDSPDDALGVHRAGWPLVADDPAMRASVARHLVALTRLGNVDRALPLLIARLGWVEEPAGPGDEMVFAAGAALVLDTAVRTGIAPEQVRGHDPVWWRDRLAARARELAAAFDERNGSSVVSGQVEDILDAGQVSAEGILPALHLPTDTPAAPALPEDPAALSELWLAHSAALEDTRPFIDHWRRIREKAHRPDAACARMDRLSAHGADPEQARELLDSARETAAAAGDLAQQIRAEVALDLLAAEHADDPQHRQQALRRARDGARRLEAAELPSEAGGAWMAIAEAEDPARQPAACSRAAELYSRHRGPQDPTWRVLALRQLAEIEPTAGIADRALRQARRLLHDLDEPVRSRVGGLVDTSAALLLARAGQLREAVQLLERVVAQDTPPRTLRAQLLHLDLLNDLGEWSELASVAERLIQDAGVERSPHLLSLGQFHAGRAWLALGRPVDAAELLEAALPVIREQSPDRTATAAWLLALALEEIGEWAAARTAFATAAMAAEAEGQVGWAGQAQLRAGMSAWQTDDAEAATAHYAAAVELARQDTDVDVLISALRRSATILAARDLPGAQRRLAAVPAIALEVAEDLPDGPASLDVTTLRLLLDHQAAMLEADHGDLRVAVTRLQGVVHACQEAGDDPDLAAQLTADLAGLYAGLQAYDEAERLLRSAAGTGDPGVEAACERALRRLVVGIADAGDHDRADRLWEELGATL